MNFKENGVVTLTIYPHFYTFLLLAIVAGVYFKSWMVALIPVLLIGGVTILLDFIRRASE